MRSHHNRTGHSVGDGNGVFIAVDASVCEMLQRTARELIGMSYLSITHPDDRANNARLIDALLLNDAPITIHKRYLRADGGVVPVKVIASRFDAGERNERLVGTICWREGEGTTAEQLWRTAYRIEALARLRNTLLGADLFPDNPMNILLRVYMAEMEGRAITLVRLVEELDLAAPIVSRWMAVLTAHGLLDPTTDAAGPRQLSDLGVSRLEQLLRAAGRGEPRFVGDMADALPR